ncbi:MAG: PAS domain S-box protein [Proteobacteria bacterium]|nr:PAS domain S-box protein [Pseudomonadota bacterium]
MAESSLVRVASALNDSKAGLPFLLRAPFQVRNLVTDSRLGELAGFAEAEGTTSLLWAPLIGRQRTLGALALLTQGARSWTQMELQWLDIFANVLSVTLENTHLFQDLATEKSQLQVLVDNVPEGVFTTDAQGRVLTWNAAAHRITGWSLADVAGRRCAELIRCSTVEETWCETRCPLKIAMQTVARFDSGVHGVSLARADGTAVPVFITSGPIVSDDGTAMGAVLVFRDITKEKEIEQMKEDFLATITHDLKSPLASVMGYAELMLNPKLGPLNDNQQEFVQSILRSSKTLQFLIDNILEITRMEAGEMQFNPRAFNIGSVLAEIREMFVPLAAPKSLRLEVRCDDAIIVRGDRDKIKEVFINLYANAVKFTRPGGAITTTVEATDERVTIRVADTGKGIAADQIARLFERFAQVKSDERRGTGLGLYIVRRIIQAHEESVEVQSEVGVGTTFSFGLPRVRIQGGDALGVLVVDRDEETSATVQRILEEEGIATALANTARDALRAVSQRKPRVLLIDSQLPELTSENLLEELKSASSREGRELGILMLCNWREDVPVESERRVYRPPEATELLRKVRALIPTEPATGAQREAS